MEVDTFRLMHPITRTVMKAWMRRDLAEERDIPWAPLSKPLGDCRLALLSSAAMALKTDVPFDLDREREDPWWGDPTHRVVPAGTKASDCEVYHLHIDPRAAQEDLNVCLPIDRAAELVGDGTIAALAPSHYSIMGYLLDTEQLLTETVPKIVDRLHAEEVDVLILVPV